MTAAEGKVVPSVEWDQIMQSFQAKVRMSPLFKEQWETFESFKDSKIVFQKITLTPGWRPNERCLGKQAEGRRPKR